jgi:hypothetical protein
LHELGALLVAASAANLGWQVIYLGASLPAPEIAGAALQRRARAVTLSLVYPENDSHPAALRPGRLPQMIGSRGNRDLELRRSPDLFLKVGPVIPGRLDCATGENQGAARRPVIRRWDWRR